RPSRSPASARSTLRSSTTPATPRRSARARPLSAAPGRRPWSSARSGRMRAARPAFGYSGPCTREDRMLDTQTLTLNISDLAQEKLREVVAAKGGAEVAVRVFAQDAGDGAAR